jgi:hypothetical protein
VALLLQLAPDLEERVLRVVDHHQQLGRDARDLAAQLGPDRPARAGHQHHPPRQVRADPVDLDAHRLAPEHVLHLHLAHLAHQVQAAGQQFEGGRQHPDRDGALAAGGDHALAQDARRRRDGDDHLVRLDGVEHARQLVGGAEHLMAGHAHALLARVVVHEAHRRAAQARVAAQLGRHLLAAVAGADDQHLVRGPLQDRPAGRPLERPAHGEARPADEHQRQQEVERDHAARRVVAPDREQEQHHDQSARGDDGGLQDRLEVLLVDEPPQLRVEAERREDRDLHRDRDPDRVREQVLVAGRDPVVEPQHVRQVVGERQQRGVHAHLADAAHVH